MVVVCRELFLGIWCVCRRRVYLFRGGREREFPVSKGSCLICKDTVVSPDSNHMERDWKGLEVVDLLCEATLFLGLKVL